MLEPQLCLSWPSNSPRTTRSNINIIINYVINRFNQKSLIIDLFHNVIMLNSRLKKKKFLVEIINLFPSFLLSLASHLDDVLAILFYEKSSLNLLK